MRCICNEKYYILVLEQEGLEYETIVEHDVKTTNLLKTFYKNRNILSFHVP